MTTVSLQTVNTPIPVPPDPLAPAAVCGLGKQDALVRTLAADNFPWWELIKFAVQTGLRTFDFGRSKKGTGAYAFKKKWNPMLADLDCQVCLVKRKTAPKFSPANLKFEVATQGWSCLPAWLTNRLSGALVSMMDVECL